MPLPTWLPAPTLPSPKPSLCPGTLQSWRLPRCAWRVRSLPRSLTPTDSLPSWPALTASLSRYRCVCEPGWSGPQCSQSLTRDACESHPCRAGGTCTSDGMGFRCTCPPGIQGACLHLPSPGPLPSFFLLISFLLHSLFLLCICLFFLFLSTLTQELGRWVSRWGPCGEKGTRNLSRLSHSACPLQAISVSCCPPAPRIPVSMGATVSLLLASWLSAPAPLVGKVYQLLLLSVTSSATYSILGDAGDPEKESTPHWLCLKKIFFSVNYLLFIWLYCVLVAACGI